MGRIIAATGLGGIFAITAIAWRLAYVRIIDTCIHEVPCYVEHQAIKDNIIIAGLIAALIFTLTALIVTAVARSRARRVTDWTVPANRGQRQTLPR